jgi:hypothetical protein
MAGSAKGYPVLLRNFETLVYPIALESAMAQTCGPGLTGF